jgi:predicted DNA-binding transcriptional regulator
MELHHLLRELGLEEREVRAYSALLGLGSCSVRQVADKAGLNRTAATEALRRLIGTGLASASVKHKKDLFSAESPERLLQLAERREQSVSAIRRRLAELVPELAELHRSGGARPAVRHYEGLKGAAIMLDDLLKTMSGQPDKTYRVFAAPQFRGLLIKASPRFSEESAGRRLRARVVEMGGACDCFGEAERRSLGGGSGRPSVIAVYGNKTSIFSLDDGGGLRGILIEDAAVTEAHRIVFDRVWESLTQPTPA